MSSSTVRISETARKTLRVLAEQTGDSMQGILDRAIETYRRHRFLEEVNRAYATVKADPKAWKEYQQELKAWEVTLADGLEEEGRSAPGGRTQGQRGRKHHG